MANNQQQNPNDQRQAQPGREGNQGRPDTDRPESEQERMERERRERDQQRPK
jgi:hypothetical protein